MFDRLMRPLRLKTPSTSPGAESFQARTLKQFKDLRKVQPDLHPKCSRGKIHQARVLSRRTRAALSVLKRLQTNAQMKQLRKAVRSLTRLLGPIRSLDVTTDLWKARLQKMPRSKAQKLSFAGEFLQDKRKKVRKKLQGDKKIRSLKAWSPQRCESMLKGISWRNFSDRFHERFASSSEKLLNAWRTFAKRRSLKNLHQLRIRLKKWRYLTEIRSECFSPLPKEFFNQVKDLQDQLGWIHDLDVLKNELADPHLRPIAAKLRSLRDLQETVRGLDQEIHQRTEDFFASAQPELETLVTVRIH